MRIGSRRVLWAINCVLLIAAALIFRPIRSWIDQVIIAKSIHPNLNVQEIHLHVNRLEKGLSVVEAKQFDWGATHGNRHFGISAERAWIVVENAALLDKTLSVPKAVLEHSKLYLDTIQEETKLASRDNANSNRSIWQQHLNDKFGDIQWHDLKDHLDGVLKLNEFGTQCRARVDGWIQSSERIAAEAKRLRLGSDQMGNPLRDNSELQGRLVKIDQLIEADGKLRSEFTSLDGQIEAKLAHIRQELDVHTRMIQEKVAQQKSLSARALARRLIEQTGNRFFEQVGQFGEVADLLCRATTDSTSYTADENYRVPNRSLVMLNNVSASGIFGMAETRSPFLMQSDCEFLSAEPFGTTARTSFRYQFELQSMVVRVFACSRATNQQQTDLQIEVAPQNTKTHGTQKSQPPDIQLGPAQWVVTSNGNSIVGELYMDQFILPLLAEGNEALGKAVTKLLSQTQADRTPLQSFAVELSGTWQSPTWQIDEQAIPAWLLESINLQLEQHHREVEQQMIARLENHISNQIDGLASELNQQLDTAKNYSIKCADEMVSAKSELSKLINAESNTEFARTSQEEVKR